MVAKHKDSLPVSVRGGPRSGTNWLAGVLAQSRSCLHVHELDNDCHRPFSLRATRSLGLFSATDVEDRHAAMAWPGPVRDKLVGGDRGRARVLFGPTVWLSRGFARPPRARLGTSGRRVVVKSVQAMLSLEWIRERWHPMTVVIHRDSLNVGASWLGLGLGSDDEAGAFVRESNRPGFGYDTHRVWSEQPTRWRSLEPSVRRRVEVVLARFPALTGDETANVPQAQR